MSYVSLFALLLIVSALAACGLGFYALTRRDVPSAWAFMLVLTGEFIWAVGYLCELWAGSFEGKLIWDNLQFIGSELSGVSALVFALVYTGRGALLQRFRYLLWLEPLATTLFVWSDLSPGLLRTGARIDTASGYPMLVYGYGPWFWVSSIYNIGLVVVALGLLVVFAMRVGAAYRKPALVVSVGLTVPLLGVLLTISGVTTLAGLRYLDISPLTFAVANLIVAWGLFRSRLLEVVPIARAQLIDQIADAVIVVNADGLVADTNPAARLLLAPRGRPVLGVSLAALWPELSTLLDRERSADHTLDLTACVEGETRVLEGRASLMRTPRGRVTGWLVVLRDVTEQRHADAALLRAKEAAEAANHAKSAFFATMSHEIRTPLNAVIGMADLLLAEDLPPEQREYAAIIRTGGQTLLGIINTILDLSKIGAGKQELEVRPFDLPTCLEEAVGLVTHAATVKGLDLRSAIAPSVPREALGDMVRLRQVVVNLLANAVKFTECGTVTLEAHAQPRADGLVEVTIAVRDTGIGIAPDQQELVFQPFAQVDSGITRRYGGTGLGLAISRQLVELMGGTISVASVIGAGSTFTVRLPLRAPASEPAGKAPQVAFQALVIEGERALREQIVMQITRLGGVVHAMATGGEALAWAAGGGQPDLALVGPRLAGLDSGATARALRGLPGLRALPIILLAADEGGPEPIDAKLFVTVLRRHSLAAELPMAVKTLLNGGVGQAAGTGPAPLRVLVVEDNPIAQVVTERLLIHLGHTVEIAAGGRAALEAFGRRTYDVVLMDIQMPDLDGIATTAGIRALGAGIVQPRIVALTASALAGDRERYIAAGMDDYLGKPVQLADLEEVLRRARTHMPSVRHVGEL